MQVLTFIVTSLLFMLGQGTAMFFFFKMIAPGGILDIVFKWQSWLDKMYGSKYLSAQLIGKALGNCELCTCFWAGLVNTFLLFVTANILNVVPFVWWIFVVCWAWLQWSMSGFFGYYFVQKMKQYGL